MPDVTLIPIAMDGRYLLITQGLTTIERDELIDTLRQFVETKGQVGVISFPNGVQWSIIKADDLKAAIVETTEENSENEGSNLTPTT